MRNHKCGCGRSSCNGCGPTKKPGPNIPACACARAFDDAYIRSIFEVTLQNKDAAAFAALFAPNGCFLFSALQPDVPPICGPAAIQAFLESIFPLLPVFTFDINGIQRMIEDDGCTVRVFVENSHLSGIGGLFYELQNHVMDFDSNCQLTLFDIQTYYVEPVLGGAAPASAALRAASASPLGGTLKNLAREYQTKTGRFANRQ
jgi:hypothetical protein